MKYIISTFIIVGFVILSTGINAQDISGNLGEARSSYGSGDLDNARFALEQALSVIDQAIGKEILALLPTEMAGMSYAQDQDDVTGTNLGFAGLYVNRYYNKDTTQNAKIEIISDSPLLAGINAILAMPMIMNSADPNQKRVKIDGYKALLQKNTSDNGMVSYDVQLPFNQSLLTFHCEGIDDENQVIGMANDLPIEKIVKVAQ